MKIVYRVLGILGLIGGIISFIFIIISNMPSDEKAIFIIADIIAVLSCGIYFSVASLLEKNSKMESKIDDMERFLLSKNEYLEFISKNEMEKDAFVISNVTENKESDENKSKEEILLEKAVLLLKNKKYSEGYKVLIDISNDDNPKAYIYLGYCYLLGYSSIVDKKLAFEYFEKAANLGIPDGKFLMGIAYLNGDGVEKNKNKGRELIIKAAKEGSKKAKKYYETHRL